MNKQEIQKNIPVVAIMVNDRNENVAGPIPGTMNFSEDQTAIVCTFDDDVNVWQGQKLMVAYDAKTDFNQSLRRR